MTPWPWLDRLLADPSVTDVCVNGAGAIHADRGQGLVPVSTGSPPSPPSEEALRTWALEVLSRAGKTWDARHPFADATVAETGHRVHLVFPPISRAGLLVSLRRLPRPAAAPGSPDGRASAEARWGASPLWPLLRQAAEEGEAFLVSGATGSGKTTLLNDLLAFVPPGERIVALEDTPELAPSHPHFLSLVSRASNADGFGEVTLRTLLRQTLRMRPDRIILGECRGDELLELLQALHTGHRGAAATLHAHSPRDALRRAELLCLLASKGSLPSASIRELLATGVRWLAQVARTPAGERRLTELHRIEGLESGTILLRPFPGPAPGPSGVSLPGSLP